MRVEFAGILVAALMVACSPAHSEVLLEVFRGTIFVSPEGKRSAQDEVGCTRCGTLAYTTDDDQDAFYLVDLDEVVAIRHSALLGAKLHREGDEYFVFLEIEPSLAERVEALSSTPVEFAISALPSSDRVLEVVPARAPGGQFLIAGSLSLGEAMTLVSKLGLEELVGSPPQGEGD